MDASSSSNSALLVLLVGSAFILIGLIFIPIAIKKLRADMASQQWPQAQAVLTHAEAVKHVRERPREEHPGLSVSYAAVLHYEYRVGTQTFNAQHGEAADNAEQAAQLAASHSPGETRSLYYQPDAAENYRVELPSIYSGLLWLLPCLAFAGFGWLVIKVGS
jgi:hypothetical protein